MALLEVQNLSVDFKTSQGLLKALRHISFSINKGEAVGLVGESGSGKSVTSLALFDLLASNAIVPEGKILFEGRNIFQMSEEEKRQIRGGAISMIFQDPMTSLNPCFTVEYQIGEVLKFHLRMTAKQAREKTIELLQMVGIPDPQSRLSAYPHELSGGMCQRVMIAMAVACEPKVLIADEPTTALDVTIQAQILSLLRRLRKEKEMAMILVSHDLGVISQNTDRVMVMYAGEIVEEGQSLEVIRSPKHPYTEGLIKCLPGFYTDKERNFRLPTISGVVPSLAERPHGCQLSPRCLYKTEKCEQGPIAMQSVEGRQVRCLYPLKNSFKEVQP